MSQLSPDQERMLDLAMASMDLRVNLAVLDTIYNQDPTMTLGQLGNLEDCLSRLAYIVERLRERRDQCCSSTSAGSMEPSKTGTVVKLTSKKTSES